jgi:hypothetical protein
MTAWRAPVPAEALATLRRRLAALPPRHPDRKEIMASTCQLYAVSRATLYRLLNGDRRPRDAHRADRGRARVMSDVEIQLWCELVAAVKKSTTNRKGRHLSTARALELLEKHGVHTPDGHRQLPPGLLTISTLNRHMRRLGYDQARMAREPAAVRFQAEHANDLWHFDMSPSDLKHLPKPPWVDEARGGSLTLMLFSVVDDRSGVAYVEYHCVYGEDVEAALGFLFRAMAPKPEGSTNPLQGMPRQLQPDNGPVAKSAVFKRVMECLGVAVTPHLPAGSDGSRTTARAKGKVERPFRTIKEAHETLYHHHAPETEEEANLWLARFVDRENGRDHRLEPHSRVEDWLANQPPDGIRGMCSWQRFCAFAREPERRTVGLDARVSVAGVIYEVDPELAGETVVLWWGLFDDELYVERGDERFGPFDPVGGPVPLHRYRKHRKSKREARADQVAALATKITIPRSALTGEADLVVMGPSASAAAMKPFVGPDPFQETTFATDLKARQAIADELRLPLGKLAPADLLFIRELLARTLVRAEVMAAVREHFPPGRAHAI